MINNRSEIFQRTELLFGKSFIEHIDKKKIIIFGLGGVGSWCAESLVRSGVSNITLVDSDLVSLSNVNRQLIATTKTVGRIKSEVLKERLLEINPEATIIDLMKIYSAETSNSFELEKYDYIIDAIDSFSNKLHLIQTATKTNAVFFSSMGAAMKMDPTRIKVAEFWKVDGCALGAMLRKRLRKCGGTYKKFKCVYSDEFLENRGQANETDEFLDDELSRNKVRVNGTTSYMPAMFGMTIASLVVKDVYHEIHSKKEE